MESLSATKQRHGIVEMELKDDAPEGSVAELRSALHLPMHLKAVVLLPSMINARWARPRALAEIETQAGVTLDALVAAHTRQEMLAMCLAHPANHKWIEHCAREIGYHDFADGTGRMIKGVYKMHRFLREISEHEHADPEREKVSEAVVRLAAMRDKITSFVDIYMAHVAMLPPEAPHDPASTVPQEPASTVPQEPAPAMRAAQEPAPALDQRTAQALLQQQSAELTRDIAQLTGDIARLTGDSITMQQLTERGHELDGILETLQIAWPAKTQ